MTSFTIPPGKLTIEDKGEALTTYQFNSKVAKHYFCRYCGMFTFVQTRLNPGEYRVNTGCVEGVNTFGLPSVLFDGTRI